MKKELTMNEITQVCGGSFADPDTSGRIATGVSFWYGNPTYFDLVCRMQEMCNDDNCWTFEAALAELQAIDPDFGCD